MSAIRKLQDQLGGLWQRQPAVDIDEPIAVTRVTRAEIVTLLLEAGPEPMPQRDRPRTAR